MYCSELMPLKVVSVTSHSLVKASVMACALSESLLYLTLGALVTVEYGLLIPRAVSRLARPE